MEKLVRFGVSVPDSLILRFDQEITQKGYPNRSEAIRDLIRKSLVKKDIDDNREVAGTLTIVYDHHTPNLTHKLDDIQHDHHEKVVSKTHIHLDHHNCLEVIIMKGNGGEIRQMADKIIGTRGVKHGELVLTTTGKNLSGV